MGSLTATIAWDTVDARREPVSPEAAVRKKAAGEKDGPWREVDLETLDRGELQGRRWAVVSGRDATGVEQRRYMVQQGKQGSWVVTAWDSCPDFTLG